MRYFHNDYNAMCHPAVLKKMQDAEKISMPGYGTDEICRKAAERVRALCNNQSLAVHFLVGGTQANMTVIDGALRAHQGVLSADSGHINVHETGAVEATGHKVLTLPATDGKINAAQVTAYMENHLSDAHDARAADRATDQFLIERISVRLFQLPVIKRRMRISYLKPQSVRNLFLLPTPVLPVIPAHGLSRLAVFDKIEVNRFKAALRNSSQRLPAGKMYFRSAKKSAVAAG